MPPLLSIVGRKNAGKTTLVVRLCAELRRRGVRVSTIKHGSHTFNIDPATTDTYRHFHEGEADSVAMISPDRFALVTRWHRELSPHEVAERYLQDANLVLCEGFKKSEIPKIEVFRRAAHDRPLTGSGEIDAATVIAMVTDDDAMDGGGVPCFLLGDPAWLASLADFVQRWLEGETTGRGPALSMPPAS